MCYACVDSWKHSSLINSDGTVMGIWIYVVDLNEGVLVQSNREKFADLTFTITK